MKKIKYLFISSFFFIAPILSSQGQVSFSCTYREYCNWNKYAKEFDDCSGYDDVSLFVMNKAETLFEHTTDNIKSTYYVKSSEYDKKNDVYVYDVTSDVGNAYTFIFDPKNKEIRALFSDKNNKLKLLRFYVKAIF